MRIIHTFVFFDTDTENVTNHTYNDNVYHIIFYLLFYFMVKFAKLIVSKCFHILNIFIHKI